MVNSGEYEGALGAYASARQVARGSGLISAEVTLLNNEGNVFYFLGRYSEAHGRYEDALEILKRNNQADWYARRLQMTRANIAVLYQKLGQYQRALAIYQELSSTRSALAPGERAQLLANMGVLYRRLGDPYKALDRYREAQALFAANHDSDGEIGVIKNMGIALGQDLEDPAAAQPNFERALHLAEQSGNRREATQALLYLSESSRRRRLLPQARRMASRALQSAEQIHATEETWKARFELGRVAEDAGQRAEALGFYREAIAAIEAMRTGISTVGLRAGFLGDKRDVYDAAIALLAAEESPGLEEIFRYMEQGRARALKDRIRETANPASIADIQRRLAPHTALLEFWVAEPHGAVLWITSAAAGLVRFKAPEAGAIEAYLESLRSGRADWRAASEKLGKATLGVLGKLPVVDQLIIVGDGRLQSLPFESLQAPGFNQLLIDRFTVSYLPSASMLAGAQAGRDWASPWRTILVAFASPNQPASSSGSRLFTEGLADLPGATEEARAAASAISGRALVHAGESNLKRYVSSADLRGVPLLHFATHAVADSADVDRSRLVFTSSDPARQYDFLFAREVAALDLSTTSLVTLAACDTELGQPVAGEGMQGISRSFLGAGARATVSTLWRISDRPSAGFMSSFYSALNEGQSVSEALRAAKLEFRRSGEALAHPRYWAGYVLNGDATVRAPRSTLFPALAGAVVLLLLLVLWWAAKIRKAPASVGAAHPSQHPR